MSLSIRLLTERLDPLPTAGDEVPVAEADRLIRVSGHWRSRLVLTRAALSLTSIVAACLSTGCATNAQNVGAAVAVASAYGARSPSHEIEQTYYLGVFDPQDQIPPTLYRVRVHGQASFLSFTKFASGWVPANVLDALGSNLSFDGDSSRVKVEGANGDGTFKTGRRLMLFGPEGFREAPANHRLVLLMGTSPEKFFSAIDESLGLVAAAKSGAGSVALDRSLFETLVVLRNEKSQIGDLIQDAKDANADQGVKK